MLTNIKLKYILELLLSLITEKKKLKILIYNKSLKTKLSLNLEVYQKASGITRTFLKTGEIKDYSIKTKKLIYQGGFLNGKKNGKGKEYDETSGQITYEGNYINGEKNGKVKEYEYSGNKNKIIFEGEYINGKKKGKGKEYYLNGKILFEGEYSKGLKWTGNIYNPNGSLEFKIKNGKGEGKVFNNKGKLEYDGGFLKGEKNGKGKEYYSINFKLKFEGEFINGKKNGKGKEYNKEGELIIEGEYLNDKLNGKVKEYTLSLLKFEGEYLNGKRNGFGKIFAGDDLLYEAEFINDKMHGKVKKYFPWKRILEFEGEAFNGYENRKGKEYYMDGKLLFDGEYLKGERYKGKGKEYTPSNKPWYEGEYFEGKKWEGKFYDKSGNVCLELIQGKGKGKIFFKGHKEEQLMFEGEFDKGLKNGNGVEYDYNDKYGGYLKVFEGEYLNGKRWNGKGKEFGFGYVLKFEGEYKKGNKVGKIYYDDLYEIDEGKKSENVVIFEGEIIKEKLWNGNGKEYKKGKLVYEGEYLNGEKVGKKKDK